MKSPPHLQVFLPKRTMSSFVELAEKENAESANLFAKSIILWRLEMDERGNLIVGFTRDEVARLKIMAAEAGAGNVELFCANILRQFLSNELIPLSQNADSRFLGKRIADLAEQMAAMNTESTTHFDRLMEKMEGISESMSESSSEVFDVIQTLRSVVSRIDKNTSNVDPESIKSIVLRTEEFCRDLCAALNTPQPGCSIDDLSAPVPERRSSTAAAFNGVDRRSGDR